MALLRKDPPWANGGYPVRTHEGKGLRKTRRGLNPLLIVLDSSPYRGQAGL